MTERRYAGRIAAPGLALGPIAHLPELRLEASTPVWPAEPAAERARLERAIAAAREAVAALAAAADDDMATEILGFQLEMLDDPVLAETAFSALADGTPATTAWRAALDSQITLFAADDDTYFKARAADLEDLRDRVHLALAGGDEAVAPLPAGAIVFANDLTPSRFLAFDWQVLGGAALARGSASSHVAMLARARGVPLLVGLGDPVETSGDAVLDALGGELIVAPSPSTTAAYGARLEAAAGEAAAAAQRVSLPAVTAAGTPISVMINVDDPEAVPDDLLRASDGVGLLRTEFLFIGRPDLPDEATQYTAYCRLLERLGGRPLILRTLDIGGDKPLPALDLPHETNPFLGLRGLRLCLAWPGLFRPQLRAAIRASAHGPLSIMLPMVSRAAEVETAREWLEEEARELGLPAPPLGIMVETPAAALALDTMSVAFASIGSNDLTQYVMAAARDSLGAVADLIDPLDPAVLRLIGLVVDTASAEGLPLSLCGDMASDKAGLEALLARGLTRVSVAPAALARVKLWISRYDG